MIPLCHGFKPGLKVVQDFVSRCPFQVSAEIDGFHWFRYSFYATVLWRRLTLSSGLFGVFLDDLSALFFVFFFWVGGSQPRMVVPTICLPKSRTWVGGPFDPFLQPEQAPRFPSSALLPFWGEGSPTKIDYRKKGHPFSNLSTGGPSFAIRKGHWLQVRSAPIGGVGAASPEALRRLLRANRAT